MNEDYTKVLVEYKKHEALKSKKIIIFGLGIFGKKIVDFALDKGYEIIEIWDNYSIYTEYNGVKVCKPHNKFNENTVILVSVIIADVNETLKKQAEALSYKNVLDYSELFVNEQITYEQYCFFLNSINSYKLKKLSNKTNSVIIKHLDFQITEKCSLKCKECANLMQYFDDPKDFNFNETIADLEKILQAVDYIYEIRVIGGEPFVCKDFYKYIEKLKSYENIGTISIFTNGTIVPNEYDIQYLKSDKIILSISDYGHISRNLERLIKLCQKNNILYNVKNIEYWTRCASFEKHNRTDNENRTVLKECCASNSLSIRNHKLFRCPFIANAWALKAIPDEIIEFVDLLNDNSIKLRNDIKSYMEKDLILACDYCLGRPVNYEYNDRIMVAEQIKKPIKYKKYN